MRHELAARRRGDAVHRWRSPAAADVRELHASSRCRRRRARAATSVRMCAHLRQVVASAESPCRCLRCTTTRTVESRAIASSAVVERGDHRHRQRVEALAPVQRQRAHAIANVREYLRHCNAASTGAFMAARLGGSTLPDLTRRRRDANAARRASRYDTPPDSAIFLQPVDLGELAATQLEACATPSQLAFPTPPPRRCANASPRITAAMRPAWSAPAGEAALAAGRAARPAQAARYVASQKACCALRARRPEAWMR